MIVVGWKCVRARVSAAEEAALEVALRLAERDGDREIVVVSVGGPVVEPVLREALAVGATRAVRVDAADGLTGSAVAAAIAGVAVGATWVVCGDASADRGTGAVPAYLAAELAAAQALGLVDVDLDVDDRDRVAVARRLDGGRRELLSVTPPAVLSVEGPVARLRRASLPAELDAHHAVIEVVPGPTGPVEAAAAVGPYRPRPRQRPAPSGDPLHRIQELTSISGAPPVHAEVVTLEPPAAAARILAALHEWGYLPPGAPEAPRSLES